MSLVPIVDQPGWFKDTVTGENINIAQWREDDKYDTIAIIAGNIAQNAEFVFFRDIERKSKLDTNFKSSRKISEGERMRVERIGAQIPLALGNTLPRPEDIKKIAECGYLKVQLNEKDVAEGPLIKFPSGFGLAGQTVETDQGIVSIGTPATAAAQKLAREQHLSPKVDVDGNLTFHRRQWATSPTLAAGLTAGAGTETPNLRAINFVRVYMHGLIQAAATQN